jgi:hypothetical protein
MIIKYEINNGHVCKDKVCFKTSFVLVKNLNDKVILGLPFIHLLYLFTIEEDGITTTPFGQLVKFNFLNKIEQNTANLLKENLISQSICLINNKRQHMNFLNEEIKFKRLEQQLTCKILQQKIERFYNKLNQEVCSNLPNAFWDRKVHVVKLPYIKEFNERNIPTKSRPIQMNQEIMEFCKNEIIDLLDKKTVKRANKM